MPPFWHVASELRERSVRQPHELDVAGIMALQQRSGNCRGGCSRKFGNCHRPGLKGGVRPGVIPALRGAADIGLAIELSRSEQVI